MLDRLKYSKKPEWLQSILNLPYYSKECPPFHAEGVDYIIQDGFKFYPKGPLTVFNSVEKDDWYQIWEIKPEWTMVDIGACIGTVCIPLSKYFKHIDAIEPVWYEELKKNISLNNLDILTITPWYYSIGSNRISNINYSGLSRKTSQYSLKSTIIDLKPNYLKCDIEGEEWTIPLEDWLGPDILKIEFHILRFKEYWCNKRIENLMKYLARNNYVCYVSKVHKEQSLTIKETQYFTARRLY